MLSLPLRRALLISVLLACDTAAQTFNIPGQSDAYGNMNPLDAMQMSQMQFNMFLINGRDPHITNLQTPSGSVSRLDLKSPAKARREYEQGYRLLMGTDPQGAVGHLAKSIAIYPQFVAAHNALGSAYLSLGQNELAHGEFAQAVSLDDHLPNSYLNLGCAELALKQYPAAEESLRKASRSLRLTSNCSWRWPTENLSTMITPLCLRPPVKCMSISTRELPAFISLLPGRGRRKAISAKRNMRWRPCSRKTQSQHPPPSFVNYWNRSRQNKRSRHRPG